jgi:iron-sulfur cluster assembly protein
MPATHEAPAVRPRRVRPSVMSLTDRAAERLRAILAEKGPTISGLRVGVKNGGCAGMEYTMSWVDGPSPFDEVVEDKGVRVLVDAKAVMFLLGTVMDYRVAQLSSQFVFENPNQTSSCGCGESVAIAPRNAAEFEEATAAG